MGSSAMPHKKNPINTEQMGGMVRLAMGASQALVENIETWEARAIEQSCVERVAWPDLFHESLRMISVMTKVIEGLVIYPDHMLKEIVASGGTYASDEAKNFLANLFAQRGIPAEEAYRIVQLAAFCIAEPEGFWKKAREQRNQSLDEMDKQLAGAWAATEMKRDLGGLIAHGHLFVVDGLSWTQEQVSEWNILLDSLLDDEALYDAWLELFKPSHLLRNEAYLFKEILGS